MPKKKKKDPIDEAATTRLEEELRFLANEVEILSVYEGPNKLRDFAFVLRSRANGLDDDAQRLSLQ